MESHNDNDDCVNEYCNLCPLDLKPGYERVKEVSFLAKTYATFRVNKQANKQAKRRLSIIFVT